jgi:hypothetical protein
VVAGIAAEACHAQSAAGSVEWLRRGVGAIRAMTSVA